MTLRSNVNVTVESHLCLSCGMCGAICPLEAIVLQETADGRLVPQIDMKRCQECGQCLQLCPGVTIRGIETLPSAQQPFAGTCDAVYVTHATDRKLHSQGQSGGVVTAIASVLLESGQVDGVVVSRLAWDKGKPRGRAYIARNRNELLASQGSKYCPMPIFEALDSATDSSEKLAVVGLPCHIHALHNLRMLYPEIAKPVRYTIGLFCDRILTYAALNYLAQRANLNFPEISSFSYRDKERTGYPGDVCFITKDGKNKILPNTERMKIKEFFTPLRCRFCFDKLNILSDIAIGDPYGVEGADFGNGESVMVVRTREGLDAAKRCFDHNALQARAVPYESVLAGQGIENRKKDWLSFANAWKDLKGPEPTYMEHIKATLPQAIQNSTGGHAAMLVQSLNRERCEDREDLLRDVYMLSGEHEPHWGSIAGSHQLVEIMGCGFVNKGAALMMLAIIGQLAEHLPTAKITSAPMPQMKRFLDYNILPLLPGFIDYHDLNVVLDASGFLYSDQWGTEPTKAAALKFEKLKAYGVKTILLPQAFGPFQNHENQKYFKRIVAAADLIFARDQISFEHIRSQIGDTSKVHKVPDFTILLEPLMPHNVDHFSDQVCIVPNVRMLDKTAAIDAKQYVDFLENTILITRELGYEAFFLIHEGAGDFQIARQVNTRLDKKCDIVNEEDPLLAKGILGASRAVVASRYHALIGSLSQSVPSICVGWSHKYQELFRDYGYEEGVIPADTSPARLREALSRLLDDATRRSLIEKLSSSANRQKKMVVQMWAHIFRYIAKLM